MTNDSNMKVIEKIKETVPKDKGKISKDNIFLAFGKAMMLQQTEFETLGGNKQRVNYHIRSCTLSKLFMDMVLEDTRVQGAKVELDKIVDTDEWKTLGRKQNLIGYWCDRVDRNIKVTLVGSFLGAAIASTSYYALISGMARSILTNGAKNVWIGVIATAIGTLLYSVGKGLFDKKRFSKKAEGLFTEVQNTEIKVTLARNNFESVHEQVTEEMHMKMKWELFIDDFKTCLKNMDTGDKLELHDTSYIYSSLDVDSPFVIKRMITEISDALKSKYISQIMENYVCSPIVEPSLTITSDRFKAVMDTMPEEYKKKFVQVIFHDYYFPTIETNETQIIKTCENTD